MRIIRNMKPLNPQRRTYTPSQKWEAIIYQGGRCFWCRQVYGDSVWIGSKQVYLYPVGDHALPYSFLGRTKPENLIICCQVCNRWKSDICFDTINEIRDFLLKRWQRERNTKNEQMQELSEVFPSEKADTEILHKRLQNPAPQRRKSKSRPKAEKWSLSSDVFPVWPHSPCYTCGANRTRIIGPLPAQKAKELTEQEYWQRDGCCSPACAEIKAKKIAEYLDT